MKDENTYLEQRFQESYHRIADYHRRLGEFFGKTRRRNPPRLVTTFPNENGFGILIIPRLSFLNYKKLGIELSAYFPHNTAGEYNRALHYIYIHPEIMMNCTSDPTEAHETTHSVISPRKEKVKISQEELKQFDGNLKRLGDLLPFRKRFRRRLSVRTTEFFAPIGITYLHGSPRTIDWREKVHNLEYHPDFVNNPKLRRFELYHIVQHLPQLAGEILVDQYHNDVRALMLEHPQLTSLNGRELWERYCVPLLTQGRLK